MSINLADINLADIIRKLTNAHGEAKSTPPFVGERKLPSISRTADTAPVLTGGNNSPVPLPSINPPVAGAEALTPHPLAAAPPVPSFAPQLPTITPNGYPTVLPPTEAKQRNLTYTPPDLPSINPPMSVAPTASRFPSVLPPVEANQREFQSPTFAPTLPANGYPSALPPTGAIERNFNVPTFAPTVMQPTVQPTAPDLSGVVRNGLPSELPRISPNPETGEQTAAWNNVVQNLPRKSANWWDTVKKSPFEQPTADGVSASPDMSGVVRNGLPSLRPSEQTAAEAARIEGKKYGFQKDANGKILRDDKGKPLYEADRDSDHNWWDIVKSAGLGFVKGGLPGAIGGAIGGTIDRNYDEKLIDEIKLNNLNKKFESQTARESAQQGYDVRETQQENIKHDNRRQDEQDVLKQKTGERNSLLGQVRTMKRYKRGEDPAFDAKLEAANIEQPDFEPGKKQPARFWDGDGNYMTFDENGGAVSVKRADGTPVVDPSRANINVNGYTVKGRDALAATTAAGTTNTKLGNEDEQDKIKYENDVRETNAFNQGVDADIQSKRDTAENLEVANDDLRTQREQLAKNPILNSEQIKTLDQQINANTNEWRKAKAEMIALRGKKKPAPVAPKPRRQVSAPQVSSGNSTFTESQARSYYKSQGKSDSEINALIQKGKAQKIIN